MPFGLRNAAQTFQRFIDEVFQGLDFVFTYIDDILVASETSEQHKQHLEFIFERLSYHGLIIGVAKCEFGVETLSFLGHTISANV